MNRDKKLLVQLKMTMFGLGAAMLFLWILFYAYMHRVFKNYVVENMEQASSSVISEINQSFLQLEEITFTLSDNDEVAEFLSLESDEEFYSKAASVGRIMNQYSPDTIFMDNTILYDGKKRFYRFYGNISNTGLRRMMDVTERSEASKYIQMSLDEKHYVGYIGTINYQGNPIGKVVMLTDEDKLYRMFEEMTENENIHISLAAEGTVIVSNRKEMVKRDIAELNSENEYSMRKQVGFTPFELLVTYEDTDKTLDFLFLLAMLAMAVLLIYVLKLFSDVLKEKFFNPLQETAYEATYKLQKAEIEKQRALIVSLKKQISAHFTVNVLNSISALASNGENEKAGLLCDGLSYLLRYANAGDSFIDGMEELFVLQKYVDIMEIRYPNRFTAVVDMEDYLENIRLPRMLLQPIVENSILHGFSEVGEDEKGRLHIYTEFKEDKVYFIIEDNGKGMDETALSSLLTEIKDKEESVDMSRELSHVALKNIERRIVSYFGDEYGIDIASEQGRGTKVTVVLPLNA